MKDFKPGWGLGTIFFFFFSFFPEVVEQIQKQITISPCEKSHHNPNSRYLPTVFVLVSKMTENLERGVLKESSFLFLPHFTLLSCCCQHRCTDSAFLWLPHILPASCQVTGRGLSASPKLAQWLGQNFCNFLNSEYRNQNLWADGKIATQGCVAFCGSIFFFPVRIEPWCVYSIFHRDIKPESHLQK